MPEVELSELAVAPPALPTQQLPGRSPAGLYTATVQLPSLL